MEDTMRLADFIRDNPAPIILEWENFAKDFVPAAGTMSPLALRDHITQILAFIVHDMKTLHPGREFGLEMSGDLDGSWDKARLGQVLSNLFGNAVQYGFYNSPISLNVEGLPQKVVLSVHNEGSPINPRMLGTLFEALTRGESGKPGKDAPVPVNLGLGLYISKEIVVAHGGRIDVTSTERDGTTFTVRLPRLASNDSQIDPATARP